MSLTDPRRDNCIDPGDLADTHDTAFAINPCNPALTGTMSANTRLVSRFLQAQGLTISDRTPDLLSPPIRSSPKKKKHARISSSTKRAAFQLHANGKSWS
ncbi:hypothetical protein AX15_003403 [Amanita polypyramis BW_CC]|nr:hypothetical protein AX15_003403 [Amanita polypyramis BW_CC]